MMGTPRCRTGPKAGDCRLAPAFAIRRFLDLRRPVRCWVA